MTQKSKLYDLEKKFEKTRPYRKPNRGLFRVGKSILIHLWQVAKMLELYRTNGWHADVAWVEKAKPNHEELLEIAMTANMVENVDIQWEEIE